MISALVPVYNTDVVRYVIQLADQFKRHRVDGEILVLEDASTRFLTENSSITDLPQVRYEVLKENIGRSKIRNLLADKAKHQWLLFSDGDSLIDDPEFLERYLNAITGTKTVVYGGTAYGPKPEAQFNLHWKYGRERECINAAQRSKNPFGTFKTNNFLVHKTCFETCRFNETVSGYGHEDTLFAQDLQRKGYSIQHIDNPLIHNGLETNEVFVEKQVHAVKNLVNMYKAGQVHDEIRLIAFYHKLKKLRLLGLVMAGFPSKEKLRQRLLLPEPSLRDLDKLKLILFAEGLNA